MVQYLHFKILKFPLEKKKAHLDYYRICKVHIDAGLTNTLQFKAKMGPSLAIGMRFSRPLKPIKRNEGQERAQIIYA